MSYPALQLVTRSWYLSGIVARNLEQVSGDQASDGLELLNELLDFKASDLSLIPYFKRDTIQLLTGVEEYYVPNLYQIETMTFNLGDVRYPMANESRINYFGQGRVNNINSLPFQWHLEREKGGSRVRVYYRPMQDYVAEITAKFALTEVTLFQDLSLVYDGFYLAYLRYALAEYMCHYYDIAFAPEKKAMLNSMIARLTYVSPPDLTNKKIRFMGNRSALNWGQVNIGKGYYP